MQMCHCITSYSYENESFDTNLVVKYWHVVNFVYTTYILHTFSDIQSSGFVLFLDYI